MAACHQEARRERSTQCPKREGNRRKRCNWRSKARVFYRRRLLERGFRMTKRRPLPWRCSSALAASIDCRCGLPASTLCRCGVRDGPAFRLCTATKIVRQCRRDASESSRAGRLARDGGSESGQPPRFVVETGLPPTRKKTSRAGSDCRGTASDGAVRPHPNAAPRIEPFAPSPGRGEPGKLKDVSDARLACHFVARVPTPQIVLRMRAFQPGAGPPPQRSRSLSRAESPRRFGRGGSCPSTLVRRCSRRR